MPKNYYKWPRTSKGHVIELNLKQEKDVNIKEKPVSRRIKERQNLDDGKSTTAYYIKERKQLYKYNNP